ncbi:NAD(P)-dependent oxidoreductase [Mixta tenebrionis]|uniref:NAD(P)-dependent oxidoreductase n=1 Tax=Mixta tenebrionis TaxID=2562439 RepID=A0A506VCI9_9GAMM|nr:MULTISPECIES: NAD(P)-dependent oxidoreductase [Mixta]QHM75483.1 2-(hydroxymethyl)glutarate dehydrogenase [Mixta theicola]TPW43365.1 NAD(P)-dependent oxidoreductase [Mixta tenebrionis]
MNQHSTVAVLGLGAMGHAFAANLLKNHFRVAGWNRTRARGEDLVAAGLALYDEPQQAVAEAQVVLAMLADGAATEDALRQIASALRQNAIFCQMGTIGVEATDRFIAWLAETRPDVVYIDAPVSGTKAPAEQAQILVLASGDRQRAAALEPVFAAIGKGTRWLGEAGAGSRMKLVVNAWLIALMQGLAESASLARQFGFTPDDLWAVLEGGPLAAPYAKVKLDTIKGGDYTPQMHLTWALKDAQLALDAAEDQSMPGLQQIAQLWRQAVEAGYGEQDLSVIYRFLTGKE